ncbi:MULTISPECIES: IS1182 family transposase [Labilibaculum]|uniref:IS1182 family transposase n=1 Tax=Labilibaculum euxinus TaxID=2686357 RepID=A0A7M4DBV7_9BACT|nr:MULTISPECIES: IS1182 family transposase [Labilibaculum]MUP40136.1 IS1182 family transposase [Labilibaculum euxinus]MVB09341.1 IS1182 family transposase [Labilibaculum euxinus]
MKLVPQKSHFKAYHQNQMILFPPSLSDFISSEHPVRTISSIIDGVQIDRILEKYSYTGAKAYHPKMMLKLLVYSYLCNVYSSRKIEQAASENVHFMWLSGMQKPDHNTIARFRSSRLKGVLKEVFSQVVLLLVDSGHIDLQTIYVDGTKIEANANKFSFVWGKAIQKNIQRMKDRLGELWDYTEQVAKSDLANVSKPDLSDVDPEKIEQTIETINEALRDKKVDAKKRRQLNYAKKNYADNLRKNEQKLKILEERNSYSKTDPDATFMRMKDDYMQNGQLKPGYNLQFSTQNQFIVNYSNHNNPTDTKTFIPHMKEVQQLYPDKLNSVCADSGYGSEENYEFLEAEGLTSFVKYNYFHKEQKKGAKTYCEFHPNNLFYDSKQDIYYCPMGQVMNLKKIKKEKSQAGHFKTIHVYQAQNCNGCPLRGMCHKAKGNRTIQINHRLNELRSKAREHLTSEEGLKHRSQRPVDVEAAFGNLKHNKGFKRFLLRGKEKVEIEMGLLALAINLKKMNSRKVA